MILNRSYWVGNSYRTFSEFITQTPAVVALHFGVHDLGTLTFLQSAGVILLPTVIWMVAVGLQRKTRLFWLFMLMWAVVFLNSGFFAIGEYNLTYALVAIAASLLLTRSRITLVSAIALIVIAFALCKSYESMFFLGPLLCAMTLYRFWHVKGNAETPDSHLALRRALLGLAALLFVAGTVLSIVAATSPANPGKAGPGVSLAALNHDRQLVLSFVVIVLFMAALVVRSRTVAAVLLGMAFVSTLPLLRAQNWPTPDQYYLARIACGGLLFVLIVCAAYLWYVAVPGWQIAAGTDGHGTGWVARAAVVVPTVLTLTLLLSFTVRTVGFHGWTGKFAQVVHTHTGLVAWEGSGIGWYYCWGWPNPSLSIVLQSEQGQAIVLAPKGTSWQPFNPQVEVPRLPRGFP